MRISITVPKPCHEDWNAMAPQQGARFCDSCQHNVADLTKATDAELLALFTSDAKPKCARFDPRQLERVLGDPAPARSALPVAAFTSLLAVAAGQEMVAQSGFIPTVGEPAISAPPPPIHVTMGKARLDEPNEGPACAITGDTIVVPQPEPEPVITGGIPGTLGDVEATEVTQEPFLIKGTLVEAGTREPLPFVAVRIVDTEVTAATDFDGHFVLRVPTGSTDPVEVEMRYVGFLPIRMTVPISQVADPAPHEPLCPDTAVIAGTPLTGRVMDAATGKPLRGATVILDGSGMRCCTDVNGFFGFPITKGEARQMTLRIEAADHAPQERRIPMEKLPFSVPIALERTAQPMAPLPSAPSANIELGEIPMKSQLTSRTIVTMGYAVVEQKPTFWDRVKHPLRKW